MTQTMNDLAKATLPLAKKLETLFTQLTSNEGTVNGIISGIRLLNNTFYCFADYGGSAYSGHYWSEYCF